MEWVAIIMEGKEGCLQYETGFLNCCSCFFDVDVDGSAVAQGIKHYPYCVPPQDMVWHKKPDDLRPGMKCSWKHLHAVDSIFVDPTRFVSVMRNVERDLVVDGTIELTKPIINISPHANG
jgi:hypothetical protein